MSIQSLKRKFGTKMLMPSNATQTNSLAASNERSAWADDASLRTVGGDAFSLAAFSRATLR